MSATTLSAYQPAACFSDTEDAQVKFFEALALVALCFGHPVQVVTLSDAGVATSAHGALAVARSLSLEIKGEVDTDGERFRVHFEPSCLRHAGPCDCLRLRIARIACRILRTTRKIDR